MSHGAAYARHAFTPAFLDFRFPCELLDFSGTGHLPPVPPALVILPLPPGITPEPSVQPSSSCNSVTVHNVRVVLLPSPSGDLPTFFSQMLFLATFFPTWEGGIYDFIGVSWTREGQGVQECVHLAPVCAHSSLPDPQEFMKASVDVADLIGLNLVMSRNAGKGEYKIMVAALGWATAELIMSRCVEQPGA